MVEKPDSVHLSDEILQLVEQHRQHIRPQRPLLVSTDHMCPPPHHQSEIRGVEEEVSVEEKLDKFTVPASGAGRRELFDSGSELASIVAEDYSPLRELFNFFNGKIRVIEAHRWSPEVLEVVIKLFIGHEPELEVIVSEQVSLAHMHAAKARAIFYLLRSRELYQNDNRIIMMPFKPKAKEKKYLMGEANWFAAGLLWEKSLRSPSIIPDIYSKMARERLRLE